MTTRQLHNLVVKGLPKTGDRFDVAACVHWYIRYKITGGDNESALTRKLRLEGDLKQLDLEERRRALIPVDDAEAFAADFIGGFAATASGRLTRFERAIVRAKSPAQARKVTQEMHDALMAGAREYADQLDRQATAIEKRAEAEEEEEEAA